MEESLRDLLEGLGSIAVGAANNHDKPANIVGEVKELLEYLAEDELPAASAIFLAKDPPGALHQLEVLRKMVSENYQLSTEVIKGRGDL
eukprot:CAMPEP_0181383728 /NCGR_PEP_ID=MMETSP1106-20121128/21534_1 /TAXON_ID=81844 /ORGANISM="Mantoniella antarctica, Strain SL-175" /LENGTH=88 /DNA_ID=CAMNT_0023503447 /DNA_START=42 /DNA_END=305 /DNA_ORIENTATION=+